MSTNNNSWQVLVKVNGKMRYIGSIQDEADAARIYDKVIIQYQGDVAKTNFNYTKAEVLQFLRSPPLIKG